MTLAWPEYFSRGWEEVTKFAQKLKFKPFENIFTDQPIVFKTE
jgi:hypothetical protein